ncbi:MULTISPECIES: molybdopterin cofactor-binding domain-containing protein [Halomonadaceae]|uniref:xanthine dehydrogenase family protein molybdopterin-binding subunit n=1 Tax=Halomonadaceae TaxID=28256 RepID=UPI00159794AD|nr:MULTISPECIES: molybdopterin cofactor-binding domain-containing protein [Halomonas]QJQ94518.1 xanthine dehydrogenase family protein molybdopterin-binding subunit [Halomonas sp. PA5]
MTRPANAFSRPLSRRAFLGGGALLVGFMMMPGRLWAQQDDAALPGSLDDDPLLDSWIRIDDDGAITVLTGKAELGQGIKTALLQVAAEELGVGPDAIELVTLVTADTARTPDESFTAGSQSMQDSATAILHAAAQVRGILQALAAQRLGVPAEELRAGGGAIVAPDGTTLDYGELVAGGHLEGIEARPDSPLKDPGDYALIGRDVPRVDIPAKVTGAPAYVQDMRLPGMVHARVVRPPSYSARLREVETSEVEDMPGVVGVHRDGNYLAVVAEREWQAIVAARVLARTARWDEARSLPDETALFEALLALESEDDVVHDRREMPAAAESVHRLEAEYRRGYQIHGSIGPSCAIGLFENDALTVWSHAQGMYPLREALAEMLGMPEERVRCIHVEGSGCYGHNGADDAGADAALLARAFPGRAVRVQWMREEEHCWEPFGPAMLSRVRGALDAEGRIVDWDYEVWSNAHSTRPGGAGALMPAWHLAQPFEPEPPTPIPQPTGGGDRNAIPLYALPNARVTHHFIPQMPLRVSALRALGGYMNVFALESFMDELAREAELDPVEFRLRHLQDERARDVIALAAERFDWANGATLPSGHGRGFGFAQYKNLAAYCAVAVEVAVERETGTARLVRAVAAIDSGQAVNPDGIRNQTEGGIIQATSWTLLEQVRFDRTRITSLDWSRYPILRFDQVPDPDRVEVHVIDRPGAPYLGTGEAAQGPTAGAIANAIADATGVRLRELPITRQRIKAAIGP